MNRLIRNEEARVCASDQVGQTLQALLNKNMDPQTRMGQARSVITLSHSITALLDGNFLVSVVVLLDLGE